MFNSETIIYGKEEQDAAAKVFEDLSSLEAKRSEYKPRYDLIQRPFLASIAAALGEGVVRYGQDNWKKGDQAFAQDAVNHVLEHIWKFVEGDRSEDHIGHAACGLMFVETFNRLHPEWFANLDQ